MRSVYHVYLQVRQAHRATEYFFQTNELVYVETFANNKSVEKYQREMKTFSVHT